MWVIRGGFFLFLDSGAEPVAIQYTPCSLFAREGFWCFYGMEESMLSFRFMCVSVEWGVWILVLLWCFVLFCCR